LGAQANGEAVMRADSTFKISGAELVELVRSRGDRATLDPLLGRPVNVVLDVPGLVIGRMAQLAGKPDLPAEGRLEGHFVLTGSAAEPRLEGRLDVEVKVSGLVGKPVPEGEAHLKNALFDVVGQGVFEDVGMDAKFSTKEVVIDRITGSSGGGTFAAILAGTRKALPEGGDKMELTGEVHLGDDESVRDRKRADGKQLPKGAVPVRQAGEEVARVEGELDTFGDYTN